MKRGNKKTLDTVVPDVEVTIRAGETELACIAFYPAPEGQWDVLVGARYPSSRDNLISVLRWAADAFEDVAFPLREMPTYGDDGHKQDPLADLPF